MKKKSPAKLDEAALLEAVARAICDAAKIWNASDVWNGASKGDSTCRRIVTRYRAEARAALDVMRGYGPATAEAVEVIKP